MKEKVTAMFDRNTRNCHRFLIGEQKGIKGTIYINKDKKIPDVLIIPLKTIGEIEKEREKESRNRVVVKSRGSNVDV
jgi:hypothetical protein